MQRYSTYWAVFKKQRREEGQVQLCKTTQYCQTVGDDRFHDQVEKQYVIRQDSDAGQAKAGGEGGAEQ